ncbi:hypothetical protein BH11ARM2_BH11ARM2_09730 [soil metagenome]
MLIAPDVYSVSQRLDPTTGPAVTLQAKTPTWRYPGPPFNYIVKFGPKGMVETAQMAGRLP